MNNDFPPAITLHVAYDWCNVPGPESGERYQLTGEVSITLYLESVESIGGNYLRYVRPDDHPCSLYGVQLRDSIEQAYISQVLALYFGYRIVQIVCQPVGGVASYGLTNHSQQHNLALEYAMQYFPSGYHSYTEPQPCWTGSTFGNDLLDLNLFPENTPIRPNDWPSVYKWYTGYTRQPDGSYEYTFPCSYVSVGSRLQAVTTLTLGES